MKTKTKPVSTRQGDIVGYRQGRKTIDCTITRVRRIARGHRKGQTEYTLVPLAGGLTTSRGAVAVGVRTTDSAALVAPSGASHSATDIGAAKDELRRCKQSKAAAADKRRHALQDKQDEMDVREGDVITVRGQYGERWQAAVVKVNQRSGRIGIDRDPAAIARAEGRAEMNARLNYHADLGLRTSVQKVRWLPPTCIAKVSRNGQTIWTATAA